MQESTITPKRALVGILVFQLGLAGLLFIGDLQGGGFSLLPSGAPNAPGMDQPIRPGDQTRRFEPTRAPQGFPDTGNLPNRLVLSQEEGDKWLLEGTIAPGDAARISGQIANDDTIKVITLNSPGGSVQDALALGRSLRRLGLNTRVDDGRICLSACPYLLASGTERVVHSAAMVGVHQHYFGKNTLLPAFVAVEDIQRGQGDVMSYLDDMGIDPLLMRHALVTPPDDIYVLVANELETYRLATTVID